MAIHPIYTDEYDLRPRASSDSLSEIYDRDDADFESQGFIKHPFLQQRSVASWSIFRYLPTSLRWQLNKNGSRISHSRLSRHRGQCTPRLLSRRSCLALQSILCIVIVLVLFAAMLQPSYTKLPPHYQSLRGRAIGSGESGRANPLDEKVFIAISLYDKGGRLMNGAWGQSILDLVDILGEDNVFLSIYENDGGVDAEAALHDFGAKLKCQHDLVFEPHLSLDGIPRVTMPDGSQRVKRIAYLAKARNRALRPLDRLSDVTFHRLLYLNDVFFDPIDAAQLLFSTHIDQNGRADYLAACAVDFINAFKFYDTYATRDLEGYSMGVPFFPWFSSAGSALSRRDVLDERDSVRVRSCWGGMVAFDARYLQNGGSKNSTHLPDLNETQYSQVDNKRWRPPGPVRFRAEPDTFYDACECCLILADLQQVAGRPNAHEDTGIYQNPFVRVAYDPRTLWWTKITRRFERLYVLPHYLVNLLARMPKFNPYRTFEGGQMAVEKVWIPDLEMEGNGSFQEVERTARTGAFCGVREMQLLVESPRHGERNWEQVPIP